jgi:hypothetical protein
VRLAAFSQMRFSSITYANQEIFLSLVIAGTAGLQMAWPIGLTIIGVLIITSISVFKRSMVTRPAAPYIVARENLGQLTD